MASVSNARQWRVPYLLFDEAGLVKNTSFDFKANLLHTERQLAVSYRATPDWNSIDETSISTLLSSSAALLESEIFAMTTAYDALNRPVRMVKPDTSEVWPTYNVEGQLQAVEAKLRGAGDSTPFVTAIEYNAKGQREKIVYANTSQTRYIYDVNTFRLTRLLTTRNAGADILQDLNYTYDPVGNIAEQVVSLIIYLQVKLELLEDQV